MIANCAFLAGLVLLLVTFWLMGQLEFLAPYKHLIAAEYLWVILGALVLREHDGDFRLFVRGIGLTSPHQSVGQRPRRG